MKPLLLLLLLALSACQTAPVPPAPNLVPPKPLEAAVEKALLPALPSLVPTTATPFKLSQWEALPEWATRNLTPAWPALQQSCQALKAKPPWTLICAAAAQVAANDNAAQRQFYQNWFVPYQIFNPDGSEQGLITGYYEPLLKGSRQRSARFPYPIYRQPEALLEIDLGALYPTLKGQRVRGRLQDKKVLPFYSRAEIDAPDAPLKGQELLWVGNAVELFFLQIQGSGRIELENGQQVKIGYAEQNGHPYQSIGKKLVDMGELKLEEASMQGIANWATKNPARLSALLGHNPSYVFFRELPDQNSAPLGALGVPLTNEYSLAVDPRNIPLGVPVFLATTLPNSGAPLNRLMLAQDTGGAIRGAVRADFFWGFGEFAASQAGRMKQAGKLWVLFPKGNEPR